MNILNTILKIISENRAWVIWIIVLIFLVLMISFAIRYVYRSNRKRRIWTEKISQDELSSRLKRITHLKEKGAISEEEFERKRELLFQLAGNRSGLMEEVVEKEPKSVVRNEAGPTEKPKHVKLKVKQKAFEQSNEVMGKKVKVKEKIKAESKKELEEIEPWYARVDKYLRK